jgi:AcrR family transcriptional regulator
MTAPQHLPRTRHRIHRAAMHLFAQKGATELSVSELAAAAGVARGTVYNQLAARGTALFEEVAEHIVSDMSGRMALVFDDVDDYAVRMSHGLRFYVRRAHQEPDWGRFFARFAYSGGPLQRMWEGGPGANLRHGMETGRYTLRRGQTRAALGMIAGGVLSAMAAVLEGEVTWRIAGTDTAELLLIALGVERKEARAIATAPLPPLPDLADLSGGARP